MSNQLIDKRTKHKVERTRKDRDIEQMLMHIGEKPKEHRKGFRLHKKDKELKLMLNCPGLFFQDPIKPDPNAPRTKYKRQADNAFKAEPKITKDTILNDIKTKEEEEEKAEIVEIKALALTLVSSTTKKDLDDEIKVKEEAIEKINAEARLYEKTEAIKVKEKEKFLAKLKANIKTQSEKVKSKS